MNTTYLLLLSLVFVVTNTNVIAFGVLPELAKNHAIVSSKKAFITPRKLIENRRLETSRIYAEEQSSENRKPKKIFLCFDGSGNSPESNNLSEKEDTGYTNVLKLHLMLGGSIDNTLADVPGQKSLYVRGAGAVKGNNWNKIIIGGYKLNFALGDLRFQRKKMKKLLKEHYQEGDLLYLFGFSRGSAAAREFCVKLNKEGLKIKDKDGKKIKISSPPVTFLGCFDTVVVQLLTNFKFLIRNSVLKHVPSPKRLGERNGIAANVKKAVHLPVMDDARMWAFPEFFRPTLMDLADGRVEEVWFPGEHGDCGGAFYKKGLGDTSLTYMMNCLEKLDDKPEFLDSNDIKDAAFYDSSLNLTKENITSIKEWMKFDPNNKDVHFNSDWSQRVLGARLEGKFYDNELISVHENVLDQYKYAASMDANNRASMYTDNDVARYNIVNLKASQFQVIDMNGDVSEAKTEELRELLDKVVQK